MMVRQHYSTRQRLADLPVEATEADAPRVTNPLVLRHPRVSTPIVYVNEFFTSHVIELPLEESEALLEELFAEIRRPEYLYVHEWTEGDLVVWDNLAVQHARSAFRGLGARRTLRRASTTEGGRSPRRAAGLAPMRAKPVPTAG
jgi:taurine dioxygenase